jgi:hypothetical protein
MLETIIASIEQKKARLDSLRPHWRSFKSITTLI